MINERNSLIYVEHFVLFARQAVSMRTQGSRRPAHSINRRYETERQDILGSRIQSASEVMQELKGFN